MRFFSVMMFSLLSTSSYALECISILEKCAGESCAVVAEKTFNVNDGDYESKFEFFVEDEGKKIGLSRLIFGKDAMYDGYIANGTFALLDYDTFAPLAEAIEVISQQTGIILVGDLKFTAGCK